MTDDFNFTESAEYSIADLKKVCRKHGCTINDLLMAVFSSQLQAYDNKVKALTHNNKDTVAAAAAKTEASPQELKEGVIMVAINLRDSPKDLTDMRRGGNQLHYEMVRFPLCDRFDNSLKSIKSQLDDFKNSNRLYYLFTAQTITGALLPKFANQYLINGVMRKGTKVSVTNICGPEEPLYFGYGNKARNSMVANYYEESFL